MKKIIFSLLLAVAALSILNSQSIHPDLIINWGDEYNTLQYQDEVFEETNKFIGTNRYTQLQDKYNHEYTVELAYKQKGLHEIITTLRWDTHLEYIKSFSKDCNPIKIPSTNIIQYLYYTNSSRIMLAVDFYKKKLYLIHTRKDKVY